MKNTIKTIMNTLNRTRRQNESFELFMQERADVFQVTGQKEQAMFWSSACWAGKNLQNIYAHFRKYL